MLAKICHLSNLSNNCLWTKADVHIYYHFMNISIKYLKNVVLIFIYFIRKCKIAIKIKQQFYNIQRLLYCIFCMPIKQPIEKLNIPFKFVLMLPLVVVICGATDGWAFWLVHWPRVVCGTTCDGQRRWPQCDDYPGEGWRWDVVVTLPKPSAITTWCNNIMRATTWCNNNMPHVESILYSNEMFWGRFD